MFCRSTYILTSVRARDTCILALYYPVYWGGGEGVGGWSGRPDSCGNASHITLPPRGLALAHTYTHTTHTLVKYPSTQFTEIEDPVSGLILIPAALPRGGRGRG